MNNHVLRAYLCDGNGGGTPLSVEDCSDSSPNGSFIWVHLDADHPDTREWLESEIAHLDPHIVDGLLDAESRPRMTTIKNGAIIILRGANLNENSDPEDMVSVRLWIDCNRVITVRRRKLKAIGDIEECIIAGQAPEDTAGFVCMLMERLFRGIEPVLNALDEATDSIEESILTAADSSSREAIVDIRKKAIMFRRYMVPQREAIDQLRMANVNWVKDEHRRFLQENYNHVTRYLEDLDALRERAQIVKDELANILTDKLNRNTYMLSVIAAIFLPLGFLTGMLGINVGGIPGAGNEYAFMIFSAVLTVIVCIQITLFKWLKWF